MRRIVIAVAVLIAGCEGCGASAEPEGAVPPVIRAIAQHRDVEPWGGWSLPGVALYRIHFAVPDRSESSIVGLDEASGEALSGAALMRRIGPLPPELLARRAFDVLLGSQGAQPVTVESRGSLGADEAWAEVRPPRMEGSELVFWAWRGEMAPELVEHRVSTEAWSVTTRAATEVIVASGRRAAVGGERCLPRSVCGCWQGCARFQLVRVPGRSADESLFVIAGEDDGALSTQRRSCAVVGGREQCARTCRADVPQATCDDAIVAEEEECTEACPPSEAFYRCELHEGGCHEVAHPIRRAAAGR